MSSILPKTLEGNPSITSPEAELWAAVLTQAIDDLHRMRLLPVIRRSAERWFQSKNHDPGSFLWICDFLGLAASCVRAMYFESRPDNKDSLAAERIPNSEVGRIVEAFKARLGRLPK